MSLDRDLLYSWLPAHIRIRDREEGEPLRALMAVVEQVCGELHDDIGGLHRNWFIETAAEWVVPYTGDLVGITRLRAMSPHAYTLRAYVANAIALRRRKGTPASLEQVAQDVTGWYASVLEMFQIVSTTQHMRHARPAATRTVALRDADEMDRLYGPFERTSHTLDVRNLDRDLSSIALLSQRDLGRYNLHTATVFLWRLRAWPITFAPAFVHAAGPNGGVDWYHMSQLGEDMPLFNLPQTKLEPASLAQEHHLPGRLRRSALFHELEARRQAEVDDKKPVPAWFGEQPPFRIEKRNTAGGVSQEIPPSKILVVDLTDCDDQWWTPQPTTRRYHKASGGFAELPIEVVVDPELGRFVFTAGNEPAAGEEVLVSYHHGFSSDLGGGTYDRRATLDAREGFSRYPVHHGDGGDAALQQRLEQWRDEDPNTPGAVIEIMDNFVYTLNASLDLLIPEGKHLEIRAADRRRPVIVLGGALSVELKCRAGLTLNGLWVQGGPVAVTADVDGPTAISLIHTTLVPPPEGPSLYVSAPAGASSPPRSMCCTLRRSITGGLGLYYLCPDGVLEIEDSIVDRQAGPAVHHGGILRARASTILGETRVKVLELASDMLFTGPVMSERRQGGIIRFSYAPPDSELPPRFQCQPQIPEGASAAERDAILHRLTPRFTSTEYGQPGYCQISASMPDEILRGASDEGEMGVYNHLEQSQRILNLRDALDEYLRLGLEAGIIYVT